MKASDGLVRMESSCVFPMFASHGVVSLPLVIRFWQVLRRKCRGKHGQVLWLLFSPFPAAFSPSPTLQQPRHQPAPDFASSIDRHQTSWHNFQLIFASRYSLCLSEKMARWEDIRDDLFEAIIQIQPTINRDQQAEIVKILRARGHDTSWNAIRYVCYTCQSWDESLVVTLGKCLGWQHGSVCFLFYQFQHPFSHSASNFPSTSLFLSVSTSSLQVTILHHQIFAPPLATAQKPTRQARKHHKHTITMGRILQNWDGETHEDILLALVQHMRPVGSDWAAVTAALHRKGYTFSEGALVYVQNGFRPTGAVHTVPVLAFFPHSSRSLPLPFFASHSFLLAQTSNPSSLDAFCNHHQPPSTHKQPITTKTSFPAFPALSA